MSAILDLITGSLWPYLAAGLAAIVGIVGSYMKGRSDATAKARVKDLKVDLEAHERMNHADLGADATDDERIDRLRRFAAKHGDRPAKAPGFSLRK